MIAFRLTFQPGVPVYQQVVYAAKKAIIAGQMRPGDRFPSVRTLSQELKINPNTAHKVVTQLIADGLLEVHPGRGTLVVELPASTARERAQLLKGQMEALVVEAKRLQMELGDVQAALSEHWERLAVRRAATGFRPTQGRKVMSAVISAVHLSKTFPSAEALLDLNLEVPAGSIFGYIGPNGSGKTTTIKTLMNIYVPSSGSATVLGLDSRRLSPERLQHVGYVSENQELPGWMSVDYFLEYCRAFYPNWDSVALRRAGEAVRPSPQTTAQATLARHADESGTRIRHCLPPETPHTRRAFQRT